MTRYLLRIDDRSALYVLSEHISQDPLENYFGRQRGRGARNDNPSAKECLQNSAADRILGSIAQLPVRGNSSRKRLHFTEEHIDDTPLPKRPRAAAKT